MRKRARSLPPRIAMRGIGASRSRVIAPHSRSSCSPKATPKSTPIITNITLNPGTFCSAGGMLLREPVRLTLLHDQELFVERIGDLRCLAVGEEQVGLDRPDRRPLGRIGEQQERRRTGSRGSACSCARARRWRPARSFSRRRDSPPRPARPPRRRRTRRVPRSDTSATGPWSSFTTGRSSEPVSEPASDWARTVTTTKGTSTRKRSAARSRAIRRRSFQVIVRRALTSAPPRPGASCGA